jgi:hypothetical protein
VTAVSYRPVFRNENAGDIFNWERFLLIPVHSGVHWTLIVVDLQQRTIRILDSMMNSEGEARAVMQMDALETFLGQFLVHNGVYAQAKWETILDQAGPQQRNGVDCGVFLIGNLDFLSRMEEPTYDYRSMSEFRLAIGSALIRGEIDRLVPVSVLSSPHPTANDDFADDVFVGSNKPGDDVDDDVDFDADMDDIDCDKEAVTEVEITTTAKSDSENVSIQKKNRINYLPPKSSWILLVNWSHDLSQASQTLKRKRRVSDDPTSRMMISYEGKQIDYTCITSRKKTDASYFRYACNTCRTAINSRRKVMSRDTILNEPASTTVLETVSRKAYIVFTNHVPGCPFSSIPMPQLIPTINIPLSSRDADLLTTLSVCFTLYFELLTVLILGI